MSYLFSFSRILRALSIVAVLSFSTVTWAIPAFPGAEGFGANALGGRGGDVYHVTSLADTETPGTLRYGLDSRYDPNKANPFNTDPRTIVFDISGTIELTSPLYVWGRNVTVAGQTAPGQGICLKNYPCVVYGDDMIVRDIRTRLGTDAGQQEDSFTIEDGNNVIVDHCSASWSVDETFSVVGSARTVTVQWCYITDSLNNSIHSKGPHGYGSLIRPSVPSKITFHHNLYANHTSRNPRPGTYNGGPLQFDFSNNVVYNWRDKAGYSENNDPSGYPERVDMNYVNNYLINGPSTINSQNTAFKGGSVYTRIYQSGNKIDRFVDGVLNGSDTGWDMFSGYYTKMSTPFIYDANCIPVTLDSADDAYESVLNSAGAFAWNRDLLDAKVTNQVKTFTGSIVDTVAQDGGYPLLPIETRAGDWDTDFDGMPDYWEIDKGFNPLVMDNNLDWNGDGYTNLEDYLNEMAVPEPASILFMLSGITFSLLRRAKR